MSERIPKVLRKIEFALSAILISDLRAEKSGHVSQFYHDSRFQFSISFITVYYIPIYPYNMTLRDLLRQIHKNLLYLNKLQ